MVNRLVPHYIVICICPDHYLCILSSKKNVQVNNPQCNLHGLHPIIYYTQLISNKDTSSQNTQSFPQEITNWSLAWNAVELLDEFEQYIKWGCHFTLGSEL